MLEQPVPFPVELAELLVLRLMLDGDLPEGLANEVLALLVPFDDEAERWKLARAVADDLLRIETEQALETKRLEARERRTDAQVELLTHVDRCTDTLVRLDEIRQGTRGTVERDLGEPSTIDLQARFQRPAEIDDFVADVFAFAIAIGPDDQCLTPHHFSLDGFLRERTMVEAERETVRITSISSARSVTFFCTGTSKRTTGSTCPLEWNRVMTSQF